MDLPYHSDNLSFESSTVEVSDVAAVILGGPSISKYINFLNLPLIVYYLLLYDISFRNISNVNVQFIRIYLKSHFKPFCQAIFYSHT